MKKIILMFSSIFLLVFSCDNGGSSYVPSSSSYSQSSPYAVNCGSCNGSGVILNPYDGNYYYCNACGGTGKITRGSGSQPSFTGSGDCLVCGCPRFRPSNHNSDVSKCDHSWDKHKNP